MDITVFAKRTAVPLTVATPSLTKNHAARKSMTSFSCLALMNVFQSPRHEYAIYAHMPLSLLPPDALGTRGSGGPGLGLIQSAVGMVKTNHQRPMQNMTTSRERVVLPR